MPSFGITPASGYPPATDQGFPRFIQWQNNGTDVGSRALVETVNVVGADSMSVSSGGDTLTVTVGGGGSELGWFDIRDYGALVDGRMVTDAVSTNGSTAASSATAAYTAADVGKLYEVTDGVNVHVTTISAYVSATQVTLAAAPSFSATGCTAYIATDDATAVQNAVNAAEAAAGGTVYFPDGICGYRGALQDTSRSNAQLLLPRRNTVTVPPITLTLRGSEAPPFQPCVVVVSGGVPTHIGGSILKFFKVTAAGTAPCAIGAWGPSGSSGNFSSVRARFVDLTVRMPVDPQITAVDLSLCSMCELDNVAIDAGQYYIPGMSLPTASTSYGLRTPGLNNGAYTRIGTLGLVGFYTGLQVGEHMQAHDLTVFGCLRAAEFVAANHSSWVSRMGVYDCPRALVFAGGVHVTHIGAIQIEHDATTWAPVYDLDDGSNYASGSLRWTSVLTNVGRENVFLVNGGAYIERTHLEYGGGTFLLTDAATVTPNCSVAQSFRWTLGGNRTMANPTAPWDGYAMNMRLIQDGTGSRTMTWPSKFKFAGGAPALSTAAGARDFLSAQYDAADDTWNCALAKAMS
jgi:hypothetical protein